jgi:hypothetical protein
MQSAAEELGSRSPRLLSVWLAAAEAEAAAATGNGSQAERQLDKAYASLPNVDGAAELPYLMLDENAPGPLARSLPGSPRQA